MGKAPDESARHVEYTLSVCMGEHCAVRNAGLCEELRAACASAVRNDILSIEGTTVMLVSTDCRGICQGSTVELTDGDCHDRVFQAEKAEDVRAALKEMQA